MGGLKLPQVLQSLIYSASVMVTLAYLFCRSQYFYEKLACGTPSKWARVPLVFFFGVLSITGTYLGVRVWGALGNMRSVGATVGGLLAGPVVGIGAGLIGGGHRFLLGGFTRVPCSLGTVVAGVVGSLFYLRNRGRLPTVGQAALASFLAESIQRILVLLIARPFDLAVRLELTVGPPMSVLNPAASALFVLIVHDMRQRLESEKQAALAAQARLEALQAQVNPHFLFNALSAVIGLCRTDPPRARDLLIHLSDFLHATLRRRSSYATVDEEMATVLDYLAIEQARMGPRLSVQIRVDEGAKSAVLPSFTIQPLVENAIKHGLFPRPSGGTVRVDVRCQGNFIEIAVSDDGLGMAPERLREVLEWSQSGSGEGTGIYRVRTRLNALFAHRCALEISSQEGRGTCVRIRIPRNGATSGRIGYTGGAREVAGSWY